MSSPIQLRPHTKPSNVALLLSDLCIAIEGQEILHSINLSTKVARLGIVGRNGSGKSTLARAIAGLLEPTSGSALVNGADMAKDRKEALRQVGFLFQNPDHQIIFPTVLEEVTFGLRQLGQKKTEADENARATLADFGKTHWADAHVAALSQGQRHLVCIMAIIAMQPRMIILDEPFSGLDIPTKMQLKAYLDKYQGTLVHVSHDPDDIKDYDHIVWMEKGTLCEEGPPEVLLARYLEEMAKLGETDDISELSR